MTTRRAMQSAASDAMARSAALTAAKSSAVGPQAEAYEAALLERDKLDEEFSKSVVETGAGAVARSQALTQAHDGVVAKIEQLANELRLKTPLYWDYRSPEPLSVAVLQANAGADSVLLHPDEALIQFLVAPGKEHGLVFAVSQQGVAWAQLSVSGDELKTRIERLRAQIDPRGYEVRGVVQIPEGPEVQHAPGVFDRQEAFELYQALLGDASIQGVIHDKPTLLWVPSGPLIGLPPGLLVTAPPQGGAAGDTDPAMLRATPWLLRSKAIALLPAVSSLRTLRQLLPAARAKTSDPLLVFADPAFGADKVATASSPRTVRGFDSYFQDGKPMAEALSQLPSLPGTRLEAKSLQRALGASDQSVLTGTDASKAQLMARNADGRLSKVKVLEFATHGLIAGDAGKLAEPALVLAAGNTPADELLLASEASTLKLNADWVLLSACNTASPDAPEAQGLSGLSRAFFFAGAKSLLVSHWSVRDDVAEKLVPAMLLAEQDDPTLTHAQALQKASLAMLDDPDLDAATPAAWAPFTLVGETER